MDAYLYRAALLCPVCAASIREALALVGVEPSDDSEAWPVGPYADGGGEADCEQHCDNCRIALDNPLTEHGRAERTRRRHGHRIARMLADNGGALPAHAWPGGYPLVYATRGGDILCADCATTNVVDPDGPDAYGQDLDDPAISADVHWEGEPVACAACGVEIESAYGVPE